MGRWMTILAVSGSASFSVFGFGNIPMYLTPFASLVLTSIIIPRASFIGHLSGILVGFLVCLSMCSALDAKADRQSSTIEYGSLFRLKHWDPASLTLILSEQLMLTVHVYGGRRNA